MGPVAGGCGGVKKKRGGGRRPPAGPEGPPIYRFEATCTFKSPVVTHAKACKIIFDYKIFDKLTSFVSFSTIPYCTVWIRISSNKYVSIATFAKGRVKKKPKTSDFVWTGGGGGSKSYPLCLNPISEFLIWLLSINFYIQMIKFNLFSLQWSVLVY